jgi:hypothetical protein
MGSLRWCGGFFYGVFYGIINEFFRYTGLKVVYGFCEECFGALHLEKSDLFMSFRFAKGYKCFGALHLPKSVNHFQLSINQT